MITYKTAESVCAGHPDKLCDFIADSILDACLYKDKSSRVACEVMAAGRRIIVAGEITCAKPVDIRHIVRRALEKVGYNPYGFLIYVFIRKQSRDIAGGVDMSIEARNGDTSCYANLGAGDQGTVYGYATNETNEYIPLPLLLSHKICKRLDTVRRDKYKGIRTRKHRTVTAFAYIMHEERPIGVPSNFYMRTCLEGYDNFFFDKNILLDAYNKCREICGYER